MKKVCYSCVYPAGLIDDFCTLQRRIVDNYETCVHYRSFYMYTMQNHTEWRYLVKQLLHGIMHGLDNSLLKKDRRGIPTVVEEK